MGAFMDSVAKFWAGLPSPLAAGIMLAVGWLAATFLRFALSRVMRLLKFDLLSERTGLAVFLRKGNVTYSPSKLVAVIAYWVVLLATFFAMSRRLDIKVVNSLSDKFLDVLPGILAAAFIAIIGILAVNFIGNFTLTITRNASLPNARLLARAIKWTGSVLVLTIALDQAGLGKNIISGMFQLIFGAVAFGFALAFGLGCKDLAKEAMLRFMANLKENERAGKGTDLEG
jgi:hypothetical protein